MAVSFIDEGNRSTRRKPSTFHKTLPWAGFELTTLVAIVLLAQVVVNPATIWSRPLHVTHVKSVSATSKTARWFFESTPDSLSQIKPTTTITKQMLKMVFPTIDFGSPFRINVLTLNKVYIICSMTLLTLILTTAYDALSKMPYTFWNTILFNFH
jgi:hypothetical protein